jgi:hypothetical protein
MGEVRDVRRILLDIALGKQPLARMDEGEDGRITLR